MKKFFILTTVFLFFVYSNIKAQIDKEYNYFSVSSGIINSFGSFHKKGATSKFVFTDNDTEEFISKNKFNFSYNFSINSGVYFHHDLRNNNWGFVTGLNYQNYVFNTVYYTSVSDIKVNEITKINSFSLPVYVKYGKSFYEKMNYSFFGVQFNYNYLLKQIFKSKIQMPEVKFEKFFYNQFTPCFFIGYNYLIINLKLEYHPVSFIDINVIDNGKNFIFLTININLYPSRYRREPGIRNWLRRLVK